MALTVINFLRVPQSSVDKTFGYQRNFAETYTARKDFIKNPKIYFASLMKLPTNEKALAFKIMGKAGIPMMPSIPVTQVQLAMKIFNRLRRGAEVAIKSSSIGI